MNGMYNGMHKPHMNQRLNGWNPMQHQQVSEYVRTKDKSKF